ncbi:MAG: hypothetical protein EBQ51_08655, partial [Verrucomicrobia bacterium]|nr:hypothetical protein [Verrucomicrobiota bacterium]
ANEAIGLIQTRDTNRPFFLYLAFNAIHGPIAPPPGQGEERQGKGRPTLLQAMSALDAAAGRVLEELDKQGIRKNTLVIFFSDNGGDLTKGSTNMPLREGKGTVFEGGIRVPAAIQWTGVLPSGQKSDQFLCVADLFPTILDVAGVKMGTTPNFDGKDLWPALKTGQSIDHPVYFMGTKEVAVFRPPWKLITSPRGQGASPMLFDVVADPGENRRGRATSRNCAGTLRGPAGVFQRVAKKRTPRPRWRRKKTPSGSGRLGKEFSHKGAEGAVIGATGGLGLTGLHHRPHGFFIGGTQFGDHVLDQFFEVSVGHGGREVGFENLHFGFFLADLIFPTPLGESLDRVLSLFDLFADGGQNVLVLGGTLRPVFFDDGIFDRGLQHAQNAQLLSFLGFHGFLDLFVDLEG